MSKHKLPEPFHMSEVDGNVPILPGGASSGGQPEGATFIDIGSLQTDPKIS